MTLSSNIPSITPNNSLKTTPDNPNVTHTTTHTTVNPVRAAEHTYNTRGDLAYAVYVAALNMLRLHTLQFNLMTDKRRFIDSIVAQEILKMVPAREDVHFLACNGKPDHRMGGIRLVTGSSTFRTVGIGFWQQFVSIVIVIESVYTDNNR
jgi:hypothetical protein